MLLYLLRHGDAETHSADDAHRALTEQGRSQARAAAVVLAETQPSISLILTSPLVRAVQTAEIVREKHPLAGMRTEAALIPGADLRRIIAAINSQPVEALLLVGHEPSMSALMSLLISGTENVRISMRKGGIACLQSPSPTGPARASLEWVVPPGLLNKDSGS